MEEIKNTVKSYIVVPREYGTHLEKCSSAGVFYWLAKYVLEHKQGVVFGSIFQNGEVFHKCIEKMDELDPLLGSKYVRSNLKNTFNECLEYLNNGRYVLFSGTPCQINSLNSYLKLKGCSHFEKLLSVDIVCHGTPDPTYFKQYLKERKANVKSLNINWRSKVAGWGTIYIKENNKYIKGSLHPYFKLFLDNYILMSPCFNCPYKGENRTASITLGDAWGFENQSDINFDDRGMSVVFIRQFISLDLMKYLSENLIIRCVNYDEAIKGNSAYYKPVKMKRDHALIVSSIRSKGLIKTFKRKYKIGFLRNFTFMSKHIIKIPLVFFYHLHKKYKKPAKSKKNLIGIVTTYKLSDYNYGNRLQNYALFETIKKFGYKPVNLYLAEDNGPKYPIQRFLQIRKKSHDVRYKKIRKADAMSGVKSTWIIDEKNEINKIFKFKKILYGSDQVWGSDSKSFYRKLGNYCVDTSSILKVSYSASLGIYSEKEDVKELFKSSLKHFYKISVRENDAVLYLKELGIDSVLTCDPVLLLNENEWKLKVLKYSSIIVPKKPYVFCYCLDKTNKSKLKTELMIVDVLDENSPYKNINHFDFVSLILNSEYVFTDSYHAILFSIIFHKNFVLYTRNDGFSGLTRFDSVFYSAGINYKFDSGEMFRDWNLVTNLENFISDSKSYLEEILKK